MVLAIVLEGFSRVLVEFWNSWLTVPKTLVFEAKFNEIFIFLGGAH